VTHRDVSIHLQLSVEGDEVAGRASTPGGPGRDFAGWIGMFAAIDALAAPDAGGLGGRSPRDRPDGRSERQEP
jgi:hypothetical protein